MAYNDINRGKIVGKFDEKQLQKTNQSQFRVEKVINKKGYKICVSNGKAVITLLIVALIKKILLYKMAYYPEANTRIKSKKAV